MGLEGLLIGVISGIIASVLLSGFLCFVKPKIIISDHLSISRGVAHVKVINKSRVMLTDVTYTLHLCLQHGDGVVDIEEILPLKPKLTFMNQYKSNDSDGKYAIHLSYDLGAIMSLLGNENNYLMFTFLATHPYSGSKTALSKEYHFNDIKEGRFETGKSIKIILDYPTVNLVSSNSR